MSLLIILIIAILFRLHIINNILINDFITEPLFFTDLLGKGMVLPWRIIFFMDLCNIFLMYLVGKKILNTQFGLIASLLYGILPWTAYVQLFGSLNIFLLSLFLIFFYGILVLKESKKRGFILITISSVVLLFSALSNWFIIPVLTFGVYKANLIAKRYLKIYAAIVFIVFVSVLILSFNNPIGIKNIYLNQIGIFQETGIYNSINTLQGESQKADLALLSKLSENKYSYLFKYLVLKSSKNLIPSTYFTPQEKLFNFSFSPPIYVGLLIPFLYGLYLVARTKKLVLIISLALIIPSILSRQVVNLSSLAIFAPVIILLISFGLIKFYEKRSKHFFGFLLYLSILLVLFQFVVTVSDIGFREPLRYKLSVGQDLSYNKQ